MKVHLGGIVLDEVKLKKIFKDINNPNWAIRTEGIKKLSILQKPEEVRKTFLFLEKENDDGLRFAFLQLLEFLLEKNDGDVCGSSLYCLILFSERKTGKLKSKSLELIDSFFNASTHFRYVKVMAFRYCWRYLPSNRRLNVTRIAGKYKLLEVTPLVLDNFNIKDEELHLVTVKVLRGFGDARGNKYLKDLLVSNNLNLVRETILTLGELGNFFDFYQIKPFLNHNNQKIQLVSIFALTQLMGDFSASLLIKLFNDVESNAIRFEIFTRLGKLKSKKAARFLVDEYLKENGTDIDLHLEWAFHDQEKDILIPVLINSFKKTDEQNQYKILSFFGEIYDHRCLSLLREVIEGSYNQFLKMAAFESVSAYDEPDLMKVITGYLNDVDDPLCYYALNSLFAHPSVEYKEILYKMLKKDISSSSLLHNVMLTFLREKYTGMEKDPVILEYVFKTIKDNDPNNQYLAVLACVKYNDPQIFSYLCHMLMSHDQNNIKEGLAKSIIKIISINPEYLEIQPDILNHQSVIKLFKMEKLKRSLVVKVCQLAAKYGVEHFQDFFSSNGLYIAQNLEKYLTKFDQDEYLEVVANLLMANDFRPSKKSMDYFIFERFENGSLQLQFLCMMMAAKWPHVDFTDFMINNTRNLCFGSSDCKGLMREFISNLR